MSEWSQAATCKIGMGQLLPDIFNKAKRRNIMQAVRRERTAPELLVARALRKFSLRFRQNSPLLPGKPDFVIPEARLALLVHGCFWHGHRGCRKGTRRPTTNREYWVAKIERNRRRDARVARRLRALGFSVYTIWECEIRTRGLPSRLIRRLETASLSPIPAPLPPLDRGTQRTLCRPR